MKIRAGFSLVYECAQSAPMLLVLNIHPSRRIDLLTEQVLNFDRPTEVWGYVDGFGNACTRIVAPAGPPVVEEVLIVEKRFVLKEDGGSPLIGE